MALLPPGMLRGLKNQDQEAELGSVNLTGLGCANPTGLQVVLILPSFTFSKFCFEKLGAQEDFF